MCPVWKPAVDPPMLDKFCHLSHDAQRVMAAIYSDYQQRRAELVQAQRILAELRNYYADLYSARFGSAPRKPGSHPSDIRCPVQTSGCDEQRPVSPVTVDTSRYSDSPPIETQDYRILSQFHRAESTAGSPGHDSVMADDPMSGSQSLFSQDSRAATGTGTSLHSHRPNRCDNNAMENSDDLAKTKSNKAAATAPIEFGEQLTATTDIDSLPESRPLINLEFLSTVANNNCSVAEMSNDVPETMDTNICARNYDLSNWPASVYDNSVKSDKNEKSVLSSISNVCLNDNVMTQQDGMSHDKYQGSISDVHLVAFGHNKDIPSGDGNSKQKGGGRQEDLAIEDESPFIDLAGSSRTYNEAPNMSNVLDESPYITPGDVYGIFKRPANNADNGKKNRSVISERTDINRDNSKKRTMKKSSFAVPLKKPKPDTTIDPLLPIVNQVSAPNSNIVDISTVDRERLDAILSDLLEASEVLLTLVYSNDSTQLREGLFSQDQKKRQPSKMKPTNSEVKGFAVASKSTDQNVYLFPAVNTDRNIHTICREFWEKLLVGSMRKVGFKSKELFSELIRFYGFDCDKVDISWTVLDPTVALWLLDPDKPAATFDQLLTALSLPQQAASESSLVALHDDMALLSVAMGRLYQQLERRELWDLYVCVETRLTPLLAAMERRPFHIATDTLLQFSQVLKKKLSKLEQQAYMAAGHSFLLSSHSQLRQVLFEELRLDTRLPQKTRLARTSVGHQTSTSEAVLTQLSPFHQLPGIVLEYRQLQKLKSTYIDGILSCVKDGVLYPHWDQTAAATGRLTAHQPNIQAIPKVPVVISGFLDNYIAGRDVSDEMELFARDAFVSRSGWSLLAADFQQIELRLLAHLADDEVLLKIFSDPNVPDIFNALAAQWLGKPVDLVTGAEREQTKRVVYSVMYGAGKEKLSEYLKISTSDAKSIITSFLVKFPAVGQFTKSCVEYCQKNGYTCSIFKRRRLIPNIRHASPPLRAQAERQAVNFCLQGSAADICKAAMLQVEHTLAQKPDLLARLLVQIHDELLLEVEDSQLDAVIGLVRGVMENQGKLCGAMVQLRVPIPVSISSGKTWGHMTPVQGPAGDTTAS